MNLWPCFRKGAVIIEFWLFNDALCTVGHDWFWNIAEVMGVMTMMWGTSLIVGAETMQIEKYSCNWTGWQRHKLGWNAKSIIAILAWNPPQELNFIYHRHHDPHTCRDSILKETTTPETNMHLKMNGWNTSFLLGWPIFRCELLVSGRVNHDH